jgi:glycosyltransferase involved in cell wall biosynthesis
MTASQAPATSLREYTNAAQRRALLIVENLSVPLDRRVSQVARALRDVGFGVTVICPRGRVRDISTYENWDGVRIHRFDVPTSSGSRRGYVREYGRAFRAVTRLVRQLTAEAPFDVIHVCNPPDTMVAAARIGARGSKPRIIFDHHDLFPELYQARFGQGSGAAYRLALRIEEQAHKHADIVMVPNDSYREIAVTRGGRAPEDVFVVRNAPDLNRFTPTEAEPELRHGKPHLIAYLGVMGPQDGVDHALHALAHLRGQRTDWHATFMGDGDVLPAMVRLAGQLGISGQVDFTGTVGDDVITRVLSTADVAIAPDPSNAFNDRSTMNKIVEYMALGRPVVCYDLAEARITAGGAALYAKTNDPHAFAEQIRVLLDDEQLRAELGQIGRARVADELSWARSREALYAAYCRALSLD